MAGHSKWANIKRRKGAVDAKRGKIFTRAAKEIIVAAKMGGPDPDGNPRLRAGIQAARDVNMPKDNIERAIKKGSGQLEGETYEELVYEGYGPEGVAILLEVVTDNRNRTSPEIKHAFGKHGGNLGESGSVAWMFKRRGLIMVGKDKMPEDELLDLALEAGAEDMSDQGDLFQLETTPEDFLNVRDAIEQKGLDMESAELAFLPDNSIAVSEEHAVKVMKLIGFFEDHDDVQKVWANFDIDDEVLETLEF